MRTESLKRRASSRGVAVEIGAGWLKLAEVSLSSRGARVSRLVAARLEGDEATPEAVARFLEDAGVGRTPVVACLPRQAVTIRFLDLPSVDPREVNDMVELQVGRQTPYSAEDIDFGFRTLPSSREGYSRVMLVIAQRSVVRQRFRLVEECGARIDRLSVTSEGLIGWFGRALAPAARAGAVLVVDVDWGYTDVSVFVDGQPAYTRSVLVGSQHLQEGGDWADRLAQEVERSIVSWRGEGHGPAVGRLVLAGARAESLASKIEAACGMKVETARYLDRFDEGRDLEACVAPETAGVSFTAVLGAAAAAGEFQIDLTPESVRERVRLERTARNLTVLGMRLMAALMLAAVLVLVDLHRRRDYLEQIRARAAATEPQVREITQMQERTRLIARRLDMRQSAVNLLREFQRLVPGSVYLTSLRRDQDQITARGVAVSQAEVNELVGALEGSPVFKGAQNRGTSRSRAGTEFEIVCQAE